MSKREIRNLNSTLNFQHSNITRSFRSQTDRETNFALYLEHRENRARKAKNTRSQRAYQRGDTAEANYKLKGYREVKNVLDSYLPALEDGGRFIINQDDRYYTLTLENYEDLSRQVNSKIEFEENEYAESGGDDYTESDMLTVDGMKSGGNFSISNPSERAGGGYYFRGGAYFPYLHDFDDDKLTETLFELGVFKTIETENYENNCLWLAFKSAGVNPTILQAMKFEFLRRTISRTSIEKIAENHNLYVEIRTDKDHNVIRYGDPITGFPVQIGSILDHYFHFCDTEFTSYSIENYDEVKDKDDWYRIKDKEDHKRDDRYMNSMNLLRTILKTNHVQKISISTHGIFKTQFYDKVNPTQFDTLEYPEKYSMPFHPKRDGGYELKLKEPINENRLDEIIEYVRSIEYGLLPDSRNTCTNKKLSAKQKENDKVRDILEFLYSLKGQLKDGFNEVEYYYKDDIGRLYAKGETTKMRSRSMQGCFSGLRAALIGLLGYDVDIENSLPVITTQWLQFLMNEKKIPEIVMEYFLDYVENRDEWLQKIMEYHECTRDQAKTIVLIVMFGGEPNFNHLKEMPKNQYRPHPKVRKLADELSEIRKIVVDSLEPDYKELCDLKRAEKNDENAYYRSVFAILTHEQEDKIMRVIREFFKAMEIEIYALIHDGLIVSQCNDELLENAVAQIQIETGYEIKLCEKPLHGLQDSDIKELEFTRDITPIDPEEMDTRIRGYVDYNTFIRELFRNEREIVLENRSETHLHGVKNYGDCPQLWNRADGDPWDIVLPGYDKRLPFKTEFKVTDVIGTLFLKNGNHKTFVRIDYKGFDEDRCIKDINSYVEKYPKAMNIKGWYESDLQKYMRTHDDDCDDDEPPEEEGKIEETKEEKEVKLREKIKTLKETIQLKEPRTLKRLEKKVRRLKLGLMEECKLLARSRPVIANIFFDFEATTKMIHDPEQLIAKCKDQILKTTRQPEKILSKIADKMKAKKLDKESEAKLYMQECPHVAYQVCFSELNEEEIHEYDSDLCAKKMLDYLVETYGCEMDPVDKADSNDVPVIRLLAHNVTYDLSFLFQYLSRSNYIERGTSIVCGRARYYRFGHEREEGTRKNFPNGDLVTWMQTEGADIYYNDGEKGHGRQQHRGVFEKAIRLVKQHEEYLTAYSDFKKIKGIGKVISGIVQCADFGEFLPTPAFCYDKCVDIRFSDTYKTIPMSLSEFGKSLTKDDQAKEVMPYDLFTHDFVARGGIATLEELKAAPNFKDHNELFENLVSWECTVEENGIIKYDMLKYSRIYCRADVAVLKKGFKVFRDTCLDQFDIDLFHYPTISSLGDCYLTEQGCYIGVHKLAAHVQRFIAQCSVGGRVMCAENIPVRKDKIKKTWDIEEAKEEMYEAFDYKRQKVPHSSLADFDGISLYPTSMERIPGFLKGAPKIWDESIGTNVKSLNRSADGYFLKIKVNTVGRKYRFPITRLKTETGNNWTNDLEDQEIFVDRFTLEDLERFSKITYTIIQGYYFNQGRNDRIQTVIRKLFDMRLKYKAEKNDACQLCIKLLMNSCYGVTGLKPIETDIRYVKEGEPKDNFIDTHFNRIKFFVQMNNNEWRFELYKEIDTHYNRQHVACEVLSVSKNIMNEVMCLAEDLGCLIHYTDTDSMHMDNDFVCCLEPKQKQIELSLCTNEEEEAAVNLKFDNMCILGKAFKEKYGRNLIGKDMGQFHTDFDFKSSFQTVDGKLVECEKKANGDITATRSIFLGKKSYIDLLEDDDGDSNIFHIRLKGIPIKCIMHKVNTDYNGDAFKMFNDLFQGEVVEFDMSAGGNVMFKVNKNHTMSTVAMKRKIKFVNNQVIEI